MNRKIVFPALILSILLAAGVRANETGQGADEQKADWLLGGGVLVSTKPYIGVDPKVYPIPVVAHEGQRLYVRGIITGYRFLKGKHWSVGAVVGPRFGGYDAGDSPALAGMSDRGWSIDAGVEASWLADWGMVSFSLVTDALGKHHGQAAELSYMALFPLAGFDVIPTAALRWRSDNLVDYYYGVRPEEATASRPAYEGDSTITPALRLTLRRKLSERWSALGLVQHEWFSSEITDSPIVEDDSATSFLLGLTYTF